MIASECKFVCEYFEALFGKSLKYCVLSGPSFAEEIILKHPTLVVVASSDKVVSLLYRINKISCI